MNRFSLPLVTAIAVVAAACSGDTTAAAPERRAPAIQIAEPGALALDSHGGLLVADRKLNRVVRIDLRTGRRRLVATRIRDIVALAFDDMGRLYVGAAERILRLDGSRRTVIAGTGQRGRTGDGGPATAATLGGIGGFEVDHDETVTIAEYDNGIRFVDGAGTISTIAGTGEEGYAGDGGPARAALLRHPHDLALRIDREVIVADSHNRVLRRIAPDGTISTFADGFSSPIAVKGGPGNTLFVADGGAGAIVRLSPDARTRTVVGRANGPINLAVDQTGVYVSEIAGARRVLRIAGGRTRVLVQ